jgi:hypothetical protein
MSTMSTRPVETRRGANRSLLACAPTASRSRSHGATPPRSISLPARPPMRIALPDELPVPSPRPIGELHSTFGQRVGRTVKTPRAGTTPAPGFTSRPSGSSPMTGDGAGCLMWCSGGQLAEFAVSHSAKVVWSSRRLLAVPRLGGHRRNYAAHRRDRRRSVQELSPRRPAEAAA